MPSTTAGVLSIKIIWDGRASTNEMAASTFVKTSPAAAEGKTLVFDQPPEFFTRPNKDLDLRFRNANSRPNRI